MKGYYIKAYGSPDEAFELRDIELSDPSPDEVIVEVEAFGINYADIMARTGLYGEAPKPPFIAGYEVVGRVVKTPTELNHLLNQRVAAFTRFGGYATHAKVNKYALEVIDDNFPTNDALALTTQYVTAYYVTNYCQPIRPSEVVLIQASAGGVGLAINQLCKIAGAKTIGLCSSEEKQKFCLDQGYDHVINYLNEDYTAQITKIAPNGLDACFNSLAGKSFKKELKLLNHSGRILLYGGASRSGMKGGMLATLKMVWEMGIIIPIGFMMGSKSLIGINMLKVADHKPQIIKQCLSEVFKLYREGKIKPVIKHSLSHNELAQAHKIIENRSSIGKVVCHW